VGLGEAVGDALDEAPALGVLRGLVARGASDGCAFGWSGWLPPHATTSQTRTTAAAAATARPDSLTVQLPCALTAPSDQARHAIIEYLFV